MTKIEELIEAVRTTDRILLMTWSGEGDEGFVDEVVMLPRDHISAHDHSWYDNGTDEEDAENVSPDLEELAEEVLELQYPPRDCEGGKARLLIDPWHEKPAQYFEYYPETTWSGPHESKGLRSNYEIISHF